MDRIDLDYSTLSQEEKTAFIKAEIERARSIHRKRTADLSPELTRAFSDLACRLSPENLMCDGEISKAEGNRRYKQIMKEWKVLEMRAGRKVSESEFPY